MDSSTHTFMIVFIAITGFAVLLQACVLLAIFFSLRKTAQVLIETTQDLKDSVLPMVHSTRELVERISPEVVTVTTGLAALTETVRKETREIQFSVAEITEKVSLQAKRLDEMLTKALNSVERAGNTIESVVAVPVRQANGVVAAIKAMVDTYRSDAPRRKSAASASPSAPPPVSSGGFPF